MNFIQSLIGYPLGFIMWAAYELVKNYGLALIIFTIITKLLQFPLAVSQQKKNAEMAVFNPLIKDIQKRHANNREKQQEEMYRLQTEYGYKPMGGCSSMIIQFVVMIGLFDVVYKPLTHIVRIGADALAKASEVASSMISNGGAYKELVIKQAVGQDPSKFAGILSPEQIDAIQKLNFNFFGIDLNQVPQMVLNALLLIPILVFVSNVISQYLSMKLSGQDKTMGTGMGYGMLVFSTLLITWFAFQVPAALGLYWIVSSIWQIPQAFIVNRMYDPVKLAAEAKARFEQLRKENSKKKKPEAMKKTVKVKKGEEEIEKELSEKEYYKLRMAKARELDAKKYGEDNDDQATQKDNKSEITKEAEGEQQDEK